MGVEPPTSTQKHLGLKMRGWLNGLITFDPFLDRLLWQRMPAGYLMSEYIIPALGPSVGKSSYSTSAPRKVAAGRGSLFAT